MRTKTVLDPCFLVIYFDKYQDPKGRKYTYQSIRSGSKTILSSNFDMDPVPVGR